MMANDGMFRRHAITGVSLKTITRGDLWLRLIKSLAIVTAVTTPGGERDRNAFHGFINEIPWERPPSKIRVRFTIISANCPRFGVQKIFRTPVTGYVSILDE